MDHIALPLQLKLAGPAETGLIEGYASVFGNVDSYGDVIAPGAFTQSLEARKAAGRGLPPMRIQHGAAMGADPRPIGVWTLMAEDSVGLRVAGKLAGLDTDAGRFNLALIRDGAMRGLSIGYFVPAGGSEPGKAGADRILTRIELVEVSVVDDPANVRATISALKAAAAAITSARDFESFLRDRAGFSKSAAKALTAGGWPALASTRNDDARAAAIVDQIRRATATIKGN